MDIENKKVEIARLARSILDYSYEHGKDKIDQAINSGALDLDSWELDRKMIIPKIIVRAILETESDQYDGKGTSWEKNIRKETKNLKLFI